MNSPGWSRRRVHWAASHDLDLLGVPGDVGALGWSTADGAFVDPAARTRFVPAPVLPRPGTDGEPYPDWVADGIPDHLGLELVLLMQAGAHAAGLWLDDELVEHRAEKRYVVRGNGKAQPTHLKTRGKSRYGSRLRLQNARALDAGTAELLRGWTDAYGPFDVAWVSCAPRPWADFVRLRPAPPLDGVRVERIPLDVDVPVFAEVERVRDFLTHGRLEVPDDDPAADDTT